MLEESDAKAQSAALDSRQYKEMANVTGRYQPAVEDQPEPLRFKLLRQKQEHELELRRIEELVRSIEELLGLLNENPGTARILELLDSRRDSF